jgi:hypothetical protein
MIDTDNVKGKYCSKQEMIFYLNAVEEAKQLRSTIDYIREVVQEASPFTQSTVEDACSSSQANSIL